MRWAEGDHHRAADRGPGEEAKIAAGRIEPHRTRQHIDADHVVQQHLAGRAPEHGSHAVYGEERDRMPHLQRVGHEQHAPEERAAGEEEHAELDHAPRIVAIGERAREHAEEQIGQPMRQDGKARQSRRMKFLEDHPVADDMLTLSPIIASAEQTK